MSPNKPQVPPRTSRPRKTAGPTGLRLGASVRTAVVKKARRPQSIPRMPRTRPETAITLRLGTPGVGRAVMPPDPEDSPSDRVALAAPKVSAATVLAGPQEVISVLQTRVSGLISPLAA